MNPVRTPLHCSGLPRNRLDTHGRSAVDVDGDGMHGDGPLCRLAPRAPLREEPFMYLGKREANGGVGNATHSHVRHARGAANDRRVGGRNVRVRTDDSAHPAGGVIHHHFFLTRRFGVHVDDDGDIARHLGERIVEGSEGVVDTFGEHLPEELHDANRLPVACRLHGPAKPRCRHGVIVGPDEPVRFLNELQTVVVIERMISEGNHVRTGFAQRIERFTGDAPTVRCTVFPVHHDEVVFRTGFFQEFRYRFHAGLGEHIADK